MQNTIHRHTIPVAVAIGMGISLLIATALTALTATLIINGTIKEDIPAYIIPFIHGIAIYIGCVVSKRICAIKRFVTEAICGCGYFLVMIIMNLLFSETGMHHVISVIIAAVLGIICAGFTFNRSSGRGYKGRRKVRFR